MAATQFSRPERRALRWMRRRGLGLQPTAAAFEVLVARLDARFRAGLAVWPVFVVALVLWNTWTAPGYPDTAALWMRTARTVVPVLGFGVAIAAFTTWCERADRRVSRAMGTRVSRTAAVPVRVVLGVIAVRALTLVLVVQVAVTVLLAARAPVADAVAFAVGVAGVWVVCGTVLGVVTRRPTVAVDDTALAVDERLRAFDALYALWPVGWASLALVGPLDLRGVRGSGLIVALAATGMLLSSALPFSHPVERFRHGLVAPRSRA